MAEEQYHSARVREHLANERTLLSWIRTGLSMMGFGVLIAKLRLQLAPVHSGHRVISSAMVGAAFIIFGLLAVIGGAWIFARTVRAIDAKDYEPTRSLAAVVVAVVIVLGVLALMYALGTLGI